MLVGVHVRDGLQAATFRNEAHGPAGYWASGIRYQVSGIGYAEDPKRGLLDYPIPDTRYHSSLPPSSNIPTLALRMPIYRAGKLQPKADNSSEL